MNSRISPGLMALAVLAWSAMAVMATDSSTATNPPGAERNTIQLSGGVFDVLKLTQNHVSDDIIVAYIENSATAYHLSATGIIYLREQGMSDRVLVAMLNRPVVAQSAPQTAAASVPNGSYYPPSTTAYVPAMPDYVTPSYSPAVYAYYNYYPSWGFSWPVIFPCRFRDCDRDDRFFRRDFDRDRFFRHDFDRGRFSRGGFERSPGRRDGAGTRGGSVVRGGFTRTGSMGQTASFGRMGSFRRR